MCSILFFLWLIVNVGINKLGDLVRFDYRRSPMKGEIYIKDESYIAKRISLELGQVLARIVIQTESCRRRRADMVNCA